MRFGILAVFFWISACGIGDQDPAVVTVNLLADEPVAPSEADLAEVTPASVWVMICDDVTAHTMQPCNRRERRTYHAAVQATMPIESVTLREVPPGQDQVIFAQGVAQDGQVTYQGFITMPVINSGERYVVEVQLCQVTFFEGEYVDPDLLGTYWLLMADSANPGEWVEVGTTTAAKLEFSTKSMTIAGQSFPLAGSELFAEEGQIWTRQNGQDEDVYLYDYAFDDLNPALLYLVTEQSETFTNPTSDATNVLVYCRDGESC